jgi:8-oxo-dGTP diphosphatase
MRLMYECLHEIDWSTWVPEWRATLLFILKDEQVLLIHKKTGFGKGKINAPGGRIEPGESARAAAIREVREEVCVTPADVENCGKLYFQFLDGFSIYGEVFRATDFVGKPSETEEAKPFWNSVHSMPYEKMWADDRFWVPHVFAGQAFVGRFLFDGETMMDGDVKVVNACS